MQENNSTVQLNHTYDEVLKAVGKLSEKEKDFILRQMNLQDVLHITNTQEIVDNYCDLAKTYADAYILLSEVIRKIYANLNAPTDAVGDIVSDYKELSADQKKVVALDLLNNGDFQKDCCNILVKDFERVASENPTVKVLDNLLGFSKYFKRCINLGIGCDHKYEV